MSRDLPTRALRRSGLEALIGPPAAWRAQRRQQRLRQRPLAEALATIAARCGDELPAAADQPLFILSAGWRSGSTLLQRLINSSEAYPLWGEPYARGEPVVRLADSLRPICAEWPAEGDLTSPSEAWDGADRWTANLHPPLASLVEAHRAFLRTLFAPAGSAADEPAPWGFKEVRLSGEHALYLRFLFPRAKFVFLVRDPADAFSSYKTWRSWYRRWPDQQIRTASAYAAMWRELAASFLDSKDAVGALLLRYEDLVPGNAALDRLDAFLDSPVDRSTLERRISGRHSGPSRLTPPERMAMRRRLGDVPARLGYERS